MKFIDKNVQYPNENEYQSVHVPNVTNFPTLMQHMKQKRKPLPIYQHYPNGKILFSDCQSQMKIEKCVVISIQWFFDTIDWNEVERTAGSKA